VSIGLSSEVWYFSENYAGHRDDPVESPLPARIARNRETVQCSSRASALHRPGGPLTVSSSPSNLSHWHVIHKLHISQTGDLQCQRRGDRCDRACPNVATFKRSNLAATSRSELERPQSVLIFMDYTDVPPASPNACQPPSGEKFSKL